MNPDPVLTGSGSESGSESGLFSEVGSGSGSGPNRSGSATLLQITGEKIEDMRKFYFYLQAYHTIETNYGM